MSAPRFQLVPGARLPGPPGHSGVGWRLLGSNNRELGRSGQSYADAESAHAAIAALAGLPLASLASVGFDASSSLWTWWIDTPEGGHIVTSGRGFRHEREARYNLQQFCEAAPAAPTSATAVPEQVGWRRDVDLSHEQVAT